MELFRHSFRLRGFFLFYLTYLFLASPLISLEKIESPWIIVLEGNFSNSFKDSLIKELKNLPKRKAPLWERELFLKEPFNLEKEKVITNYNEKKSYQHFNSLDPLSNQEVQKIGYENHYLSNNKEEKVKTSFWVDLSFSFKKKMNLNEYPFPVGYILIKKIENLLPDTTIFEIYLKDKEGLKKDLELFFPKKANNTLITLKIKEEIASFLINYSWIDILPTIETKNTTLFINNKKISLKDPLLLFWPKEMLPIKISIEKTGYETWHKEINEANLDLLKEKIKLTSIKIQKEVKIKTTPSQANVYMDNLWIGLTPLNFIPEEESSFLTLKKEGYNSLTISTASLEAKSSFNLNLSLEDQKVYNLKKRKTLFYASLSTFIFSLVPTAGFVSWDLQNQRLQEMGYPQKRTISQSLLWSSVGLNLGTLIWNIVESILYVKEVEKNLKY